MNRIPARLLPPFPANRPVGLPDPDDYASVAGPLNDFLDERWAELRQGGGTPSERAAWAGLHNLLEAIADDWHSTVYAEALRRQAWLAYSDAEEIAMVSISDAELLEMLEG